MANAVFQFVVKVVIAFGGSEAAAVVIGYSIAYGATGKIIAALAFAAAAKQSGKIGSADNADYKRDVTLRGATEARRIVYGEVLSGGVLAYSNVTGPDNAYLVTAVAHAGHQVYDLGDMYFDADVIDDSYIGTGTRSTYDDGWSTGTRGPHTGKNDVDGDPKYDVVGDVWVSFDRKTGVSTQSASSLLTVFSDIDAADQGRGIAYSVSHLVLNEESNKVWEAGSPRDYKCLVKGKIVYDPRLDVSNGAWIIANGFSAQSVYTETYKTYSTNPVLCAVDYLIDDVLGMAIDPSSIDWDEVADEADFCDGLVYDSAAATESRFTCNGSLSTYDTHKTNIQRILSSCNGSIAYKNGKWFVKVGRYGQGANLVTNGTFANLTGWTEYGAGTAAASGQLTLTAGAGLSKGVYRSLGTLTDGAKYYAQIFTGGIDSNITAKLAVYTGTAESGTLLGSTSLADTADNSYMEVEFIADGTAAYIHIEATDGAAGGGDAVFDNAEVYFVAAATITGDWLRDTMGVQTSLPKNERFNGCRAFYFSKDETYKQIQSLEVSSAINLSRDNQEVLTREINLPMTETEDEAQRILYKQLKSNERQVRLTMPCNYLALDLAVHDRVMVTIDDLSYTNKVFQVEGWVLADSQGGVDLVLVEDSIDYWRDPDVNDYATRTATGVLVPATPEVPEPTSVTLTARTGLPDMLVSWVDPQPAAYYDYAQVWRHTSNDFGSATLLIDTRSNTYTDTTAVAGTDYYYWVRSRKGTEYSSEVATTPTNSTAAAIAAATATNIEWAGVLDGAGTIPDDNATVGGTLGTNIKNEAASVISDLDAINSYAISKGLSSNSINFNPFFDIARDDDTPAGYYIGDQTGSESRTTLIEFEDANKTSIKINSGYGTKLVTTASVIQPSMRYFLIVRIKGDASTFANVEMYHMDANDLGSGNVALCTSPTSADSEVATATRAITGLSAGTLLTVSASYATRYYDLGFPYLLDGVDVGSPYSSAVWLGFGLYINTGVWTDTNIYIDTFSVIPVPASYSNSGAP